jgi:hypothetical protein
MGRKKHTLDDINDWLKSSSDGIKLIGEYTNALTKTTFQCVNGHSWLAVRHSVKNIGSGCPECVDRSGGGFRISEPAWEYCFIRDNYIKFDITNNLENRLKDHRRHGHINIVHLKYHKLGKFALDWENALKVKYGGRYASKEQCPDGYTETLPKNLLEHIISNNQL